MAHFFTLYEFGTDWLLFILDSFRILLDMSLELPLNKTFFLSASLGKI